MIGRDDSPWYPTARLFRQSTRGQWDDVVDRIRTALAADLTGPRRRIGHDDEPRP